MNDKLDQIIVENNNKLLDAVNGLTNPTLGELVEPASKAILALIKELVAEAKPRNSETQRGSVTVYGDLSERELNIIDQFEQNLLKALEEV